MDAFAGPLGKRYRESRRSCVLARAWYALRRSCMARELTFLRKFWSRCCRQPKPSVNLSGVGIVLKFWRLSSAERSLVLQSFILLAWVRVVLWVLPFRWVSRVLARHSGSRRIRTVIPEERLIWAVRVTAPRVPGATCLVQAIAAKYLLERCGREPHLHFGITKDNGRLLAHAWLILDGRTVFGGEIAPIYSVLTAAS